MKTTFFTICLLLVTSQVFSWSDLDKKGWFTGCISKNISSFNYKQQIKFCSCSVDMSSRTWSMKEISKRISNGTWAESDDHTAMVNKCVKNALSK